MVQVAVVGFVNWQQPVYFAVGILIVALALPALIRRRRTRLLLRAPRISVALSSRKQAVEAVAVDFFKPTTFWRVGCESVSSPGRDLTLRLLPDQGLRGERAAALKPCLANDRGMGG